MISQVSFTIDGTHNIVPLINILKQKIKGLRHDIEKVNRCVYKIYIASQYEDEKTVFHVCYGIQSNVILDYSKKI